MRTTRTRLPLAKLDRYWAQALGCEPSDLRSGTVRLVPCGQRQLQVLATPDGAVVIGLPSLLERVAGAPVERLLEPRFWAERFGVSLTQIAFYGPGFLAYLHQGTFTPHEHPFVRPLRRRDAGELARFARILQAREPHLFHAWAIGGRVTANERLWGAYVEGKIVSVAGLRAGSKLFQEIGINTLPRSRQQGWGTAVASAATADGLTLTELVQWSAPLHNEPSLRLSQRLGYLAYAHQLWLSLPEAFFQRGS